VQAAKARAERLQMALRRAEAAHHAGDLGEAKQAVEEALALDPNETQAKALQHVIAKQVEEQARQVQMRQLLDEAHHRLAARKITEAFEFLKSAEVGRRFFAFSSPRHCHRKQLCYRVTRQTGN